MLGETILMFHGLRMPSYLKIPIWDTERSFGSCSDCPTGFLAAVFTPGCFEAGFPSCCLAPTAPAALPGWDGDPGTPSLLSTAIKQRGRSAPAAYPGISCSGTHLCTDS